MYSIYIITCVVNAKQYVGITNDLSRRWRRHRGANDNQLLHKAIKKHGVDNFVFTHFADAFDAESAKSIEKMLIVEHNTFFPNGYNVTNGGDGTFGYKHSNESKQKSRESNIKAWADTELRKSLGQKISAAKKGTPSPKKGKPSGKKGVPLSEEHAKNIQISLNTVESKKKRSEIAKKALSSPEWRAAQSARVKAIWAIRKAKKMANSGAIA